MEVDSDEDDNSVSEQGETNKKTKIQATAAIIWKNRIATIAQNKSLCQTRFSTTTATVATGAIIWLSPVSEQSYSATVAIIWKPWRSRQ